jgi:hypothetical protein
MCESRFGWRLHVLLCVVTSALCVPLLAGCGPRTATISGKVLYKGKPVGGGILSFTPVDAPTNRATTFIDEDGHYEITAQVGMNKITVDNRALEARHNPPATPPPSDLKLPPGVKVDSSAKAKAKHEAGKFVALPFRYFDPENTDLEYDVKGGTQTHDIVLNEGPTKKGIFQ